jgi:hypothetical protein
MMFRTTDQYLYCRFFSKLLEKLMYNRLISFVVKNNILTEAQNGFRENKSTETASQTFVVYRRPWIKAYMQ